MVSDGHMGSETTVHRWQTYQFPKQEVEHFIKDLAAGGVAGALSKTCTAPLERVKILFQTGTMTNNSISQTLLRISQNEGIQGWYRGNGASVLRVIPYAAFHFAAYEQFRTLFAKQVYGVDPRGRQMPPLLDLLAGSSAGGTAVLLTYPLDLVRTRLAYDSESGVGGRKSAASSQTGTSPKNERLAQQRADRNEAVQLRERAGSHQSAGTSHGSQTSMQPSLQNSQRNTIRSVLKQTWQTEGPRGLYRGIGPTLMGILPYAGLKFYMYQSLKQQYWKLHPPPDPQTDGKGACIPIITKLTLGGLAGVVAQTFTYPLDVVRRSMQVQKLRGPGAMEMSSTWAGLKQLVHRKGFSGLFAGLSINYLKVVPSTAVGFTVYDAMKSYLGLPQNL